MADSSAAVGSRAGTRELLNAIASAGEDRGPARRAATRQITGEWVEELVAAQTAAAA